MGDPASSVAVVVADDQPLYLDALRGVVNDAPELRLAGEATDAASALTAGLKLRPGVLVLEAAMPGPSPTEIVAALGRAGLSTRLLCLSSVAAGETVRQLLSGGVAG